MNTRFQYLLGVLLVANLAAELLPRTLLADGNPATSSVVGAIPYTGRIEFNGAPYNGSVTVRFSLYDGADDLTADWTQETEVAVFNGTFQVNLGPSGLSDVIDNADDLRLGMELLAVEGVALDASIALAGRQQLLPVAYALHAAEAADFSVNRDLLVARNTTVTGNADVTGTSRLRGAITADGAFAAGGAISTSTTISASGNITSGATVTAVTADINGTANVHALNIDNAAGGITGSGNPWLIRNGGTTSMSVESDGDVAFARSIAVAQGIAVAGATSTVSLGGLSIGNIILRDADDYVAFVSGTWTCPSNGVMRGVNTGSQDVSIDLGPFGSVSIPVFVVRPVCAPGN